MPARAIAVKEIRNSDISLSACMYRDPFFFIFSFTFALCFLNEAEAEVAEYLQNGWLFYSTSPL